MTEVRFYHLQRGGMEHNLPPLLAKIASGGHRVIVKLESKERVKALDSLLWTFDPQSFLPHGSGRDAMSSEQLVWITDKDENPNDANVLVLADGMTVEDVSGYKICCEMFNGHDPEALKTARKHWKLYKDQGFDTIYYQQNDGGGWVKVKQDS